jgi:hypothetical protein
MAAMGSKLAQSRSWRLAMRSRILLAPAIAALCFTAGAARAEETSRLPSPPPQVTIAPYPTEHGELSTASPEEDRILIAPGAHHGGYGGPEMKLTSMVGEPALLVGGQAGWIIDRRLVIGGAGYGLASDHSPGAALERPEGPSRLNLGYGGVRAAWIIEPRRIVHASAALFVGAGGLSVVTHDLTTGRYDTHHASPFFALEPSLEVELNVARFVRVALIGSYRYLGDTRQPGLHSVDLSGPAAALAIRFGSF